MIKVLKSNKITCLFIFIICLLLVIKPNLCIKSSLNGLSVWTFKVFPTLFPFFIFTKLLINSHESKQNILDKFFCKIYHAPQGSFFTFLLSAISGYPTGSKLIAEKYNNNQISSFQAERMLSFCSISGPMFMIGSVGVAIFNSYTEGLLILISNVLASLINGVFFRPKTLSDKNIVLKTNKKLSLSDIVNDSLMSILMVGGYIVLSFVIIDAIKQLGIIEFVSDFICLTLNNKSISPFIEATICGILEITKGVIELSYINCSLAFKTILSSTLIAFGGISILLQSKAFLNVLQIKTKTIICQKFIQSLLCLIISIQLSIIFL